MGFPLRLFEALILVPDLPSGFTPASLDVYSVPINFVSLSISSSEALIYFFPVAHWACPAYLYLSFRVLLQTSPSLKPSLSRVAPLTLSLSSHTLLSELRARS